MRGMPNKMCVTCVHCDVITMDQWDCAKGQTPDLSCPKYIHDRLAASFVWGIMVGAAFGAIAGAVIAS